MNMNEREIEIHSIHDTPLDSQMLVVLKEKSAETYFQIVIDVFEAKSIIDCLKGRRPPRPNAHDLLYSTLKQLKTPPRRVIITKVDPKRGTVYAAVELEQGGPLAVDARPSDALALAVRAGIPVYATEQLLDAIAEPLKDANPSKPPASGESQVKFALGNEERRRLSTFSKFIDSLGQDSASTSRGEGG